MPDRVVKTSSRFGDLRLLLLFVGACLALPRFGHAEAQLPSNSYLVNVWQMEQGLPENIVNAIAQTPDGYLWCGTTRGLVRFDGVRFQVFNNTFVPAFNNNNIRQLFVDSHGTMWIAVSGGSLVRFQAGEFKSYDPPPRKSANRTFILMAEDASGALWLTTEDGALFRFDNEQFTWVSGAWDPGNTNYYHVRADARKNIFVRSRNGLAGIEEDHLKPVLEGKPGQYDVLCASRGGGWWIENAERVRLWKDGKWVADAGQVLWDKRRVDTCLEDLSGYLWVGVLGEGLWRYGTNTAIEHISTENGLGSDLIRALFEDFSGNLWVGTRAGGLNRLRPAIFQTYGKKDGLASDQVTAICEDGSGGLWVGTDGDGVNRIKNGQVWHYGKEQGLAGLALRTLLCDTRGELWAGSWAGGLYKWEHDRFTPVKDFSGPRASLVSLLEDSEQRLWLGQRTLNKLFYFTNGSPASAINLSNTLPSMDITAMVEDREGNLWIGTHNSGLLCWRDGQCRQITQANGLPTGCNNNIRSLLVDEVGGLWIGTMDGGLCRLKNGHMATCTTREGLPDNVINFIADDGMSNYWFSSFGGIFRVNKAQLNEFMDGSRPFIECVTYGKSDGLPTIECQGGFQPAGCRTRDGKLWFPTIKGLVAVDPQKAQVSSIAPHVLIEELSLDSKPFADCTYNKSEGELQIPPGRHRYLFRYTGLDFTAPESVHFRTKLEGLDEDWVDCGEKRLADYGPLPPGNYTFKVIARSQIGIWSETGASLAFRVLPHVWQTWWFKSGIGMLGAVGLAGLVLHFTRRRYKRRLAHLETQLTIERERSRIAQDIHDGVGANLTEIAWLADVAEKEAVNAEEVRTQARKISGTARETVQLFDEIVWAVLPDNDTLKSLVEYLGRRVDEWFENSPTRCWYSAPRDLPDCMVPAELRHSIYLACKESLHNARKHAQATEVRVQITLVDHTLKVEITDNGRGFDTTVSKKGNGLRNLRKRFEKLRGHFELESKPGHGTTMRMSVHLPSVHRPTPPQIMRCSTTANLI